MFIIKNLQIYRLPVSWNMTGDQLSELLQSQEFKPCEGLEKQSQGWIPPRENGKLVYGVGKQMLLKLMTEKKLLPSSVVNEVTKDKAVAVEEQQGFKPGRKQMKEIKEEVIDDLLPKAFRTKSVLNVWIDPVNGWLVIDSGTASKADDVIKHLIKAVDKFPMSALHVNLSPVTAMTSWLLSDEAPAGFTVDQDSELRGSGEGKATVRYVRHTLEAEDVQRHIGAGKQCTRLAMTWNDRISFVLTESMTIKRITPLDVIKESKDNTATNDDERFDADMTLMTGELQQFLKDLTFSLGGEKEVEAEKRAA